MLDRRPLRVKLVAAILLLVTAALLVTGAASVVVVRSLLVDVMDQQLRGTTNAINQSERELSGDYPTVVLAPVDYYQRTTPNGKGVPPKRRDPRLTPADLPPIATGLDRVNQVDGRPYNTVSPNRRVRWRMLETVMPDGSVVHLAQNLSTVDSAVHQLYVAELLVGSIVLALLALLGVGLVRASLRPLRGIEHTAAAIANGDLTRRVPDYEPPDWPPRTEVGRLSRALNTMLGQIEAAFTAREKSARAALESEARALRSEERMRQFVADASHELRTPLTSIRGFAELYRQTAEKEPERAGRLVARIEQEAARMGLLVGDLLLLARLDQERPLTPVELELSVIANDAVIAARATAPDREITLDIPDGTGPVQVMADESRLRQVVGNLMSNALTHTPAGSPVWLRLRREDGQAVVEVEDRGPGLSDAQVERVFERFYRVDKARTRHSSDGSGAGLGLAIVAALVSAHSGTVEVDSEPGHGATFRVRLPIHS